MVLKRRAAVWLFLLCMARGLFPQGADAVTDGALNYASAVLAHILRESPEGRMIANNVAAAEASLSQQQRSWLPSVQLDAMAKSQVVQGDYQYVRNGGIISDPQLVLGPSANIGIYQKLPGSGQLSIDAGYGFSYLPSQNAYIQQPYLQVELAQTLSYGAFFLTRDPATQQLKNQKNMTRMEHKEALLELATDFISAVQNYDLALLEQEYYGMLASKADAEYREQNERYHAGQKSTIDLFTATMNRTQAVQQYQQASQKAAEAKAVLACYEAPDIMEQTGIFRDALLALLESPYGGIGQQTMQEYEILNEIENEKLSLKLDKTKLAPALYVQAALTPNQGSDTTYSDLSRSLRDLMDLQRDWSLSASVGIHLGLDYTAQKRTLKKVSDGKIQNLSLQLEVLRGEQDKMRALYQEWTVSFSAYCAAMEQALQEQEGFRKDIKPLLERNIITEAEYWAAEASYYEVRLNYYRSVWNMIQGKLNILTLSSDWMEFIQQFMEVIK